MNKRVAGFVALLGLAVAASSAPASAQDADSPWLDDPSTPVSAAPPAPAAPGSESQPPANGPQGQALPANANQPPAYGPQGQALPDDTSQPPGYDPQEQAPPADASQPPGYDPQGQALPDDASQAPPADANNVPETDPSALTEFSSTLDPYGTWVQDQRYGTVWVPNRDTVGADFAPYVSAGHWALTDDDDWSWQSDYPFGGVVFHYGRWVWAPNIGWAWVAGRRYANAWVNFRVPTGDYGYVGWAPMPPSWGWYGGSAVALASYPPAPYVFCPSGYAFSYNVHSYIVHDRDVIRDLAAHTRNFVGAGRLAARPRVLPANSAAPRGPSLQSAHVPPSFVNRAPRGFASASRPYFTNVARRSNPYLRSNVGLARPAYRASSARFDDAGGWSVRSSRTPSASAAYRATPNRPSVSVRSYSAPRYSAPVRSYSAPRSYYSAPVRSYSAPVRSYSAPVRSYSAPVRSYSAPVRSYSAPVRYSAPRSSVAPSFHSAPRGRR